MSDTKFSGLKAPLSRRGFVAMGSALSFAAHPARAATGADQASVTLFETAEEKLRAYRKICFTLDNGLTFQWTKGVKSGLVDDVLTPLHGMLIAFAWDVRDIDETSFAVRVMENTFYTDLESDEPIDEFFNPYTNEIQKFPPPRPLARACGAARRPQDRCPPWSPG